MSLKKLRKNLNKATAVGAVIGIATCLFPAITQAQQVTPPVPIPLPQFTGVAAPYRLTFSVATSEVPVSNSDVRFGFSLDLEVEDVNSLESVGEFPGAIENFEVDTNDDNPDLFFPSGTLKTSRLTIDPTTGNFPGLSFGYEAITDNDYPYAAFNNDGLRYDFTFDNRSETLTLFIASNDSSQINSLLGLLRSFPTERVQGVVSYPDVGIEQRLLVSGVQRVVTKRVVSVPEPTATASLLSIGALGAVLLHKRNKRLSKLV